VTAATEDPSNAIDGVATSRDRIRGADDADGAAIILSGRKVAMRVRLVGEVIVLRLLDCYAGIQLLAGLPRMRWDQPLSSIAQWTPVHLVA
jgi:hypothetical protein